MLRFMNFYYLCPRKQCGGIWTDCNHNKKLLKRHSFYSINSHLHTLVIITKLIYVWHFYLHQNQYRRDIPIR